MIDRLIALIRSDRNAPPAEPKDKFAPNPNEFELAMRERIRRENAKRTSLGEAPQLYYKNEERMWFRKQFNAVDRREP